MKVEIRSDHVLLDGYVNAVGRDSSVIPDRRGGFVEQVVPGTFARALGRGNQVKLMLNHERDLGGTATNDLELFEDNIGLRAKAKVTDAEVIQKARNKKLRGWSFGFSKAVDEWEERADAPPRRYLKGLYLNEVTIVDEDMRPVYPATSIEVRGEDESITEYRAADDTLEYVEVEPQPPEQETRGAGTATLLAGYKARRLKLS